MNKVAEGIVTGLGSLEAAKEARGPRVNRVYISQGMPEMSVQGGGIVEGLDDPNMQPDEKSLTLGVLAAVLGELSQDEASQALAAYMQVYGREELGQLIDEITDAADAEAAGMPSSMSDGMLLQGPGGGMDDQIPAQVAGTGQPLALSPGEYVVPADVVSGLGDGSTEAGAQRLEGLMDEVRKRRTGTTEQPRPLSEGGKISV